MNAVISAGLRALPALVGALMGLKLFVEGLKFAYLPISLVAVAALSLWAGRWAFPRYPAMGRALIEIWVLSAVGVISLATAAILWVTVNAPVAAFVDTSVLDKDSLEAVSTTFVGAVTAYIGFVWTKDAEDGSGFFWPSGQFRMTIAKAFQTLTPVPVGTSRVFAACFRGSIPGNEGTVGWDFADRTLRTSVFRDATTAGKS